MPTNITINVEVKRNVLPDLLNALPGMLDRAQADLVDTLYEAALKAVPIGQGPEHNDRLARNATLYQSHYVENPSPYVRDLINDALHAGLVYYGNPLSPPRPWFEWALSSSWNWYRGRLQTLAREIQAFGG